MISSFRSHFRRLVFFFFLLVTTYLLAPQKAQAADGGAAVAFLARLKQAPARVVGIDGKDIDASVVAVDRRWKDGQCFSTVTNHGDKPLRLDNIILFDLAPDGLDPKTPFYGEGFQMLSQNVGTLENPRDLGQYSDREHYKIPEPGGLRTAYGLFSLDFTPDSHVVLGFSSCRRFIGRFSFDAKVLRISVDPEGLELAPGETWKLEEFFAATGPDRNELLARLADAINVNQPPLARPLHPPTGWCSYYSYGGPGNAAQIRGVADRFAQVAPGLHYLVIDEGRTNEGDPLDTDPGFGNLKETLDYVRSKGFQPGMWVGPFIAGKDSKLFKQHSGWFVQTEDGKPLDSSTVGFGGWRQAPWYCLDGTNPEAQKYLETVFHTMSAEWNIHYFKLDANYWGAIRGRHYDPKATRIEAYRRGMQAIIRGAGPGAIIEGCNGPMWPSIGMVNEMRTSNDASRSMGNSTTRENFERLWQNGRLWYNDPDVIMLAGGGFDPSWAPFQATVMHAVGGAVLSGDKAEDMKDEQAAMLRKLVPSLGKGAVFPDDKFEVGVTDSGGRQYYHCFNWDEKPVDRALTLTRKSHLTDFWTGEDLGIHEAGSFSVTRIAPHGARLIVGVPVP